MTPQENVLKILHLNDLHSHFENYPKIKRFFADKSAGFSDVLRFDIGDHRNPVTDRRRERVSLF